MNRPTGNRGYASLAILILLVVVSKSTLAQHLRQFNFWGSNGASPNSGLALDNSGNFYGSTFIGGRTDLGVIYEISQIPGGGATQAVIYSFTGGTDGANPIGDLVFDQSGNLYGVTQFGGQANQGTVFELSPPEQPEGQWTESILYSFQGSLDGAQPVAGLVSDNLGNLYGTTSEGGITNAQRQGCGTVFEISPPSQPGGLWSEAILYSFGGAPDGSQPACGLIFDLQGNLYGTTSTGGQNIGTGSVFELFPPQVPGGRWTETILHSFSAQQDGDTPLAGLALDGDALYGTASEGGLYDLGTVFRLLPYPNSSGQWTYEVVHNFSINGRPVAALTIANPTTLYGATAGGSIFEISASGNTATYTNLYNLGNAHPQSRLTLFDSALYGTTVSGGFQGNGTVFRLSR